MASSEQTISWMDRLAGTTKKKVITGVSVVALAAAVYFTAEYISLRQDHAHVERLMNDVVVLLDDSKRAGESDDPQRLEKALKRFIKKMKVYNREKKELEERRPDFAPTNLDFIKEHEIVFIKFYKGYKELVLVAHEANKKYKNTHLTQLFDKSHAEIQKFFYNPVLDPKSDVQKKMRGEIPAITVDDIKSKLKKK